MQAHKSDDIFNKPLPKTLAQYRPLSGAVCRQYKRCGRQNCCCRSGNLHGPYFYRFWRQDGRLRKQYVPLWMLPQTLLRCAADRHDRVLLAAANRALRQPFAQRYAEFQNSVTDLALTGQGID